ncbi:flagellar hook-length control protein FliK [Thermincola potens]|uniref:Flagellar hook-length control protein-like C-terminal domain-containing protein n=1 Tax=Thermincola potens (strain JR) TaxID=635013 RepID=D5XE46_THEPJ|nr:flagellar hook-length control protein FliK [Thermincola potens]ADG81917.1 hypothetical protein TherJR_1052 [Thermincola potens JR]
MDGIIFQVLSYLGESVDREPGIVFRPGDVINVFVKQVTGNQALLRYEGQLFLARLEANVEAGARLQCLVQGERDGKIQLKLLAEGKNLDWKADDLIGRLLKKAGVAESSYTKQIALSMLQQGMAVTRENVEAVLAGAKKVQASFQDLDLLVFLHKMGLPIEDKILSALKNSIDSPDSLGRQLADIRNMLMSFKDKAGPEILKNPETVRVIEKIINLLDRLTIKPGESSENTVRQIALARSNLAGRVDPVFDMGTRNFFRSGSIITSPDGFEQLAIGSKNGTREIPVAAQKPMTQEQQVKANAMEQRTPEYGLPEEKGLGQGPAALAGGTKRQVGVDGTELYKGNVLDGPNRSEAGVEYFPLKEILPRLIRLVQARDIHNKTEFITKLHQVLEGQREFFADTENDKLPDLLNRFLDFVKDEPHQAARELVAKISDLVDKFSVYQEVNRTVDPGRESFVFLQSLVDPDNPAGAYEVLIRFKKDGTKRKVNYENCQVTVSLNTVKLGLVRARVRLTGRELTGRFIVENEQVKKTVDAKVGLLKERLQGLGFTAKILSTEVAQEKERSVVFTDNDKDPLKINQIDLRV